MPTFIISLKKIAGFLRIDLKSDGLLKVILISILRFTARHLLKSKQELARFRSLILRSQIQFGAKILEKI